MRRPRFTIRGLLAFILVMAVGLAGLKGATETWDGAVLGLTLLLLLASVLLAAHANGAKRAYWLGFALFGWSYLVLCQIPSIEARLPTTRGLAYLDSLTTEDKDATPTSTSKIAARTYIANANLSNGFSIGTSPNGTIRLINKATARPMTFVAGARDNFARIGHSLMALILGLVGAVASRFFHEHESARTPESSDQETPTNSPTSSSDPVGSDASILIP